MAVLAICERPGVKVLASSQPLSPQYVTWLVKQLAILALARQASVDPATFKLFAASLSAFDPNDCFHAIDRLCHTKRETGETAFPDLPTLEEAVLEERNKRWKAERLKAEEEYAHQASLQPHEYVAIEQVWKALNAKREAEGKPALPEPSKRSKREGYFK